MEKVNGRLDRIFDRAKRKFPWATKAIDWIGHPERHFIRMPIAVLLIIGTLLSFLPGFGLWMLPIGLVLLSVDVPAARGPTTAFVIRAERWFSLKWRIVKGWFR